MPAGAGGCTRRAHREAASVEARARKHRKGREGNEGGRGEGGEKMGRGSAEPVKGLHFLEVLPCG